MASRRGQQRKESSALSPSLTSPRVSLPSSSRYRSSGSSSKAAAFDLRGMRDCAREIATSSRGKIDTPRLPGKKREPGPISKLPLDLLCKCFLKLESVFQIINCASVCRTWRDACSLDVMWKSIYLQWHGDELDSFQQQSHFPPSGSNWRESFVRDFSRGRAHLLGKTITRALDAGFLQSSSDATQVLYFTPRSSFQSLAQELQLTFHMRINNGQQFRLTTKEVIVFPSSCVLHCPLKSVKRGLKLSSLSCIEVIVSSDSLSQSCSVVYFTTKTWYWASDYFAAPLRLVEYDEGAPAATSLIVGTLFELQNDSFEHEEILFMKVGMHLALVISKLLKIRNASDRVRLPPLGLEGYHVSVQLHSFDNLVWSRNFHGAFCNPQESIPGDNAVLLLISSFEVVPKKLSLPWRSEAFSGIIEHEILMGLTLWNARMEILWQIVKPLHLKLVTLPCVEYGEPGFEGPQFEATVFDKQKGLSASIKCSLPLDDREAVFAITDLRVLLSKKFMVERFGIDI